MEQKIAEVETAIEALQSFKHDLTGLIDRTAGLVDCKTLGGDICSIIEQSNVNGQQPVPIVKSRP